MPAGIHRLGLLAAALVVGLVVAFAWERGQRSEPERPVPDPLRTERAGAPELTPSPTASRSKGVAAQGPHLAHADLGLLGGSDPEAVRAAAARLRGAARTTPAVLEALREALLDPTTGADLRARLAIVLGTLDLPEVDRWLLEALASYASEPGFVAAAALALGAQRTPPDDDDVFNLAGRPRGVDALGGLGITLRRSIAEAETRAALARLTGHELQSVRYAAARALGESAGFPDTRAALTAALGAEKRDDVAARLAEPLAAWAASAAPGPEREAVLSALLERALSPGADEARFRLEKDFARSELSTSLLDRLLSGAEASSSPAVRLFALTVLPGAAGRTSPDAVERVRRLLEDVLAHDDQADLRDLAARQLGALPSADTSVAALAQAARKDFAWRVRFSAVAALALHAARPAAVEALRVAAQDTDERVAAEARRALEALGPSSPR